MNAMNPRQGPSRRRHGRHPFGPMTADAPTPPFAGPVDDENEGPRGHRGGPGRAARRGPFGPGFGPGPGMPPGRGFPGPRGRGRGRRTARGDIRAAVLALVAEQPRHGYEIIQEIAERSGGAWRPSPGSVYPTLSQLEDEGLVRATDSEGRKTYELTPEGREQADEHALGGLTRPEGRGGHSRALREALEQLHLATKQVAVAGSPAHEEQALEILQGARRALYQLLAAE